MSWNIKFNEDSKIIEVTYYGNVTGLDLREATKARISMQKETGTAFVLVDALQTLGVPSLMDLYDLPDKIYPDNNARHDTRIALIFPERRKSRELANFFQTAAKNRAWIIELFEDREKALSWLLDSTK